MFAPCMEPALQAWRGPASEEHGIKSMLQWHELQLAPRFVSAPVQAFRNRHRLHFDEAGEHDALLDRLVRKARHKPENKQALAGMRNPLTASVRVCGWTGMRNRPPTRLPQVVERPCQHLTMVGSTLAILGFTMRCLWKRDKLLPKVRDCPGKPTVEKYGRVIADFLEALIVISGDPDVSFPSGFREVAL